MACIYPGSKNLLFILKEGNEYKLSNERPPGFSFENSVYTRWKLDEFPNESNKVGLILKNLIQKDRKLVGVFDCDNNDQLKRLLIKI
jgi:hypothetical protein